MGCHWRLGDRRVQLPRVSDRRLTLAPADWRCERPEVALTCGDLAERKEAMPTQTSSARQFFDHIRGFSIDADRFDYLSHIPNPSEPFFEQEWIDFKSHPQNDKDARKIWSKALSGYANLMHITDGVVVWGIDARKTPPRDIDAAHELKLVPDPLAFESKLRDWIRDATNPPVMGVEYISCPGPSGEGFVVCIIPESAHKPHRAEWSDKHYYYRAGDDFLPAEPAMLRHLFYPRFSPDFQIEVSLELKEGSVDGRPSLALTLRACIQNVGNSTARDVYIRTNTTAQINGNPWLIAQDSFWALLPGASQANIIVAKLPLHPGFVSHMWTSRPWLTHRRSDIVVDIRPAFADFQITFYVYCNDSEDRQYEVNFTQDDLHRVDAVSRLCKIIK